MERFVYGRAVTKVSGAPDFASRASLIKAINVAAAVALVIYLFVGSPLFGHSGKGKPPMFGDFEAQRHWMEVTVNLPLGEWYWHTKRNDLLYWGLDYPPLTAYVSYMFGRLAQWLVPELVELATSRGCESSGCVNFMRMSVILCDFLVYIPAAAWIASTIPAPTERKKSKRISTYESLMLCVALHPTRLLIDHGHFQYNGVCIGLTLIAMVSICRDYDVLGSILFCMALNFKQMTLYYAPVFFFVLLGKMKKKGKEKGFMAGLGHFMSVGGSVIATFCVLWAPFCLYPMDGETCSATLLQVLHRLFPFARGIFEDKVANIWYCLSILIDFREWAEIEQLARMSLLLTLVLLAPIGVAVLGGSSHEKGTRTRGGGDSIHITLTTFLLALVASSLAFFLASFQVHEKSLLLALVPALILPSLQDSNSGEPSSRGRYGGYGAFMFWFQLVGLFTMHPLLLKDGQLIPYWICFCATIILLFRQGPLGLAIPQFQSISMPKTGTFSQLSGMFVILSFLGIVILHGLQFMYPSLLSERYPDLHPALFSIFGAVNLVIMYLVTIFWLYDHTGWGYGISRDNMKVKKDD